MTITTVNPLYIPWQGILAMDILQEEIKDGIVLRAGKC